MALSSWQKKILIVAILAVTIPISTCRRRRSDFVDRSDIEQNLRDICSKTDNSDLCWNILKPQLQIFDDSDGVVDGLIDLAIGKSKVFGDQLNKWFRDSNDDILKEKYGSCSDNYDDVERNLEEVHRNLDSDDYRRIADQIDDAEEQLDKCKHEFGSNTFDSGHVGDRNNELGLYLEMIRIASDRL